MIVKYCDIGGFTRWIDCAELTYLGAVTVIEDRHSSETNVITDRNVSTAVPSEYGTVAVGFHVYSAFIPRTEGVLTAGSYQHLVSIDEAEVHG